MEDPDAEEESDAEEGMAEITFNEALLGGEEETEDQNKEGSETGKEGQLEEIRTGFDEALFDYIRENGQEKENFMVSPVSLKAALCLAPCRHSTVPALLDDPERALCGRQPGAAGRPCQAAGEPWWS